ncbi:hypothetical protein BD779DRAFT_1516226 [Infundibulicybe gibba]|nr:hypothetical protein BD779DRAFT_1516226 [Infundibulicybe gibba]
MLLFHEGVDPVLSVQNQGHERNYCRAAHCSCVEFGNFVIVYTLFILFWVLNCAPSQFTNFTPFSLLCPGWRVPSVRSHKPGSQSRQGFCQWKYARGRLVLGVSWLASWDFSQLRSHPAPSLSVVMSDSFSSRLSMLRKWTGACLRNNLCDAPGFFCMSME